MAKSQKSGAAPANKEGDTPTNAPANATPAVADPATSADENTTAAVDNGTAQVAATEEVEKPEVKESMKRDELNAIATEEGLTNVSTYKDKAAVVAAVERVRAGEDASVVDEELTPVVDNGTGDVEVEVANPFYDLEAKKHRKAGDSYKTTESRAAKLRGLNLLK